MTGPLCSTGRCAQILAAIAAREETLAERQAAQVEIVLRLTLGSALAAEEPVVRERVMARVPAALRAAVAALPHAQTIEEVRQ